jgi:hypothetical protein
MKFAAVTLFVGYASAFAPAPMNRATTALSARTDSSKAIQDALEASKKYGATSPEARVLWDIVEEMDASDNR